MKKFWPATSYPEGYKNREPYCAAAVCYWLQQWLAIPEVRAALNLTPTQAEAWRCKSARAFDWPLWASKKKGVQVLDKHAILHTGDIMVFDMSHIGLVITDSEGIVETLEANTGATGGRDGDGIFVKKRARSMARCFIRILP